MSENDLEIRNATLGDLETIVQFNVAMAAETEDLQLDVPTVRKGVEAALEDGAKGRYYLALLAGKVAGQLMVTFEWSDWRNGMFLWIQSVYVAPDFRRRGVFKALYQHVLEESRQPAYCGVRLYVHDENGGAMNTYERMGMHSPGYLVMETPDQLRGE